MKVLYIIRGVSGSGKSTLAFKIANDNLLLSKCFEADQFFRKDGEYVFDASKLKEAHEWCRGNTEAAMKLGIPNVIVSNTFTQKWEYAPYLKLAEEYGYEVQEIIVRSNFKNVHNVPDEIVKKQRARFEY